jgi:chromosome segregation and condensation protein ScpB
MKEIKKERKEKIENVLMESNEPLETSQISECSGVPKSETLSVLKKMGKKNESFGDKTDDGIFWVKTKKLENRISRREE